MVERLDRERSEVRKGRSTKLIRIAQIQQQVDVLRARLGAEARWPPRPPHRRVDRLRQLGGRSV